MVYRIDWTEATLTDLRSLVCYIARDDLKVAQRFGDLIMNKVNSLHTFPRVGRMVPEYREHRLRELIVSPYRIVYEIDDDMTKLSVLRIWHGARGNLETLT
jgi:toxin ParE1/3/4